MSVIFDPFTGQIIDTGSSGGGGGAPTIGGPVVGADPSSVLIVDSTGSLSDVPLQDGELVIGSSSGDPAAATLTGTTDQVNIANGANSITLSLPQSIASTSSPTFNSLTLTNPLTQANGGTGYSTAANGELLIGNGTGFSKSTLTGTTNQVNVTNGSGSITLSLPQDIAVTSSPQFANVVLTPSGSLDITAAGGTLAIGTTNADIINIGNSGAVVNVQGTTFYQNVTDLLVTDKRITLNVGGSAGSASNSGIEIEEDAVVTAYVDTTADRLGWELKAPGSAGIVTIVPGASGFIIDQGSHNPVTLGTANGLSLSVQQLSLDLSSASTTGALSSTDYNTFNNKQAAGNYITDITGDATASGPGSAALTLSTVNANVGTFNNVTVNGKGLVTAASNVAYLTGNETITLSGDVTGSGTTTITTAISDTTVTGKLLTGFSSAAGTVSATDSILTAFNKTDGNVANRVISTIGDIEQTTWTGLANNTADQTITGFSFLTSVSSFKAFVDIYIDNGASGIWTSVEIIGKRVSVVDWTSADIQFSYTGQSITGLSFSITSAGQVRITVGNISGFVSGVLKFRAQAIGPGQVTNAIVPATPTNYITDLTGDIFASGPGSVIATLPTINANTGVFTNATITVNGKGQITAASSGSGGSGTVTSVAITPPQGFSISGSPITTSGTIVLTPLAEFDSGNSGSSKTINWDNATGQKSTLTANCTYTFSNLLSGQAYVLRLVQGGAGSFTVTWPAAVKWAGGTPPTLSTAVGAIDVVTIYYDGTNAYASAGLSFS